MANYYVTKVRYGAGDNHIVALTVADLVNGNLVNFRELSRDEIINLVERGHVVKTAVKAAKGYNEGSQVNCYTVTRHYLKTTNDKSELDNLENLPSY